MVLVGRETIHLCTQGVSNCEIRILCSLFGFWDLPAGTQPQADVELGIFAYDCPLVGSRL